MWQAVKIKAIAENSFECEDAQGNRFSLPKYAHLSDIKPGEEIGIFVSKDKSGLVKKVLAKLLEASD